ncbi:energy transducer TonB [Flavobacterium sp. 17A]|uniref:Energy transducer TonB n=1 Tax=Flavobacterium potami TaxID=2872310 RepID=A0A9X1HBH0_9FLAO|nr:energy transducer TonB [Flavobacterium potami]MBZ4035404.1 energy transducer TonB [Flavobacterium potami]
MRIFFAAVGLILFFSCQNKSVPVVKEPENNKKVVPQKPVKKVKTALVDNSKIFNTIDVDVKPDFKGGINKFYAFLKKNYIVPKDPDDNGSLQGGIFTKFIIEKDGSISNIEVIRDIGYGTGEELERVLKLCPDWNPAMKDGKPVRCLYSFPYYIQQK